MIYQLCREYRKGIGYTQEMVAKETGLSQRSISHFENGETMNYNILLWYVYKGLPYEHIIKGANCIWKK